MAVFCSGLAVLIAGCGASPLGANMATALGPYFMERQMEALEGQVSSLSRERDQLTRRLEVMEGQMDRLTKHPWLSSVGEQTLESLPEPSESPTSLFERRPPPEDPEPPPSASSPSASKKRAPARARRPAQPTGEERRRAPLSRLARLKHPYPIFPGPSPSVTFPSVSRKRRRFPFSRLARIVGPPKVRERSAKDLLRLGRRHFEAGELAEAVEKLQLSLERTKDGARLDEALVLIGRAELARGRPLVAAASFRQLLETAPKSPMRPEALYHAGEAFHRLYDKVQALKQWKELEARYPSHPLSAKAGESIRQMAAER